MYPIRYIHAADLHLDAAFRGLRRKNDALADALNSATFAALTYLVELCEREKPDFLVIAGDIYNEDDHSLKAQLALRDACLRLQKNNIPVFLVHGNHDPISSRLNMIEWPENTIIFGDRVGHHVIKIAGQDKAKAVIHGISHVKAYESRNLATAFSRLHGEDDEYTNVFQLGVLHCALTGAESVKLTDRYAPCSLEDLTSSNLDAWALGHVHEKNIVSKNPFIAYSGNTQGLHINEQDERGCYIVHAMPQANGARFDFEAKFHTLGPVVWKKIDISVENVEHVTDIGERIVDAMDEEARKLHVQSTALIVRVYLQGRTVLDASLRYNNVCTELTEFFQDNALGHPLVWLQDIIVETSQPLYMKELLQRDDLLGETLRLGRQIQENQDISNDFVKSALAPLFEHTRAKNILTKLNDDEAIQLLDEAERLCADIMENR